MSTNTTTTAFSFTEEDVNSLGLVEKLILRMFNTPESVIYLGLCAFEDCIKPVRDGWAPALKNLEREGMVRHGKLSWDKAHLYITAKGMAYREMIDDLQSPRKSICDTRD